MATNKKVFSDAMDCFARENSELMYQSEMMHALYDKFGMRINIHQLKNAYVRLGIKSKRRKKGRMRSFGDKNKTHNGFVRVLSEEGWVLEHIKLWKENNGDIEKHSTVAFIDGDRNNVELSNLECLSRREFVLFNKLRKTYPSADGQALLNIARIRAKVRELEC